MCNVYSLTKVNQLGVKEVLMVYLFSITLIPYLT